jgi:hypothetical protein
MTTPSKLYLYLLSPEAITPASVQKTEQSEFFVLLP